MNTAFYIICFIIAKPRRNWLYYLIQLGIEFVILGIYLCTIYLAFS